MSDIETVKQRLDIVEVISGYIPLQKAGRNFKARCPFHAEKTPSFFVFPERQAWHCFGACGTGGDVFSFVMKKENLDFGETLHRLAQKAGVTLQESEVKGEKKEEKRRLAEINAIAASYYNELLQNAPEAEGARRYVLNRGLSQQTIKDFQLGFSPNRLNGLLKYLVGLGCQEEELLKVGLVIEREQGGRIDRFRYRLMFPIRDARGEVLGFGARALDDSFPKYLNSPQTPLFDKGSILYALDRAKETIRKHDLVVIVEGYMDAITAHQHGFNNVVASMGTSLTDHQVNSLKKLTKNIAFALDADAAGQAATQRGIVTAAEALDQKVVPVLTPRGAIRFENVLDAEIRVIELPAGDDPDQLIRRDAQQWQTLVEKAPPVVDYFLERVASSIDQNNPEDKSKAVQQMQPLIGEIKDPVRRAHYIQRLARLVAMDERTITEALQAYGGEARSKGKDKRRSASAVVSFSKGSAWEEYCLTLILTHPETHHQADKILPEYFQRAENRQLFQVWTANHDVEALQTELEGPLQEHLSMLLARILPPMTDELVEKALEDGVLCLRERWLTGLKAKERSAFLSEAGVSDETAETLQQSAVQINAQLREVFETRGRTKPADTV